MGWSWNYWVRKMDESLLIAILECSENDIKKMSKVAFKKKINHAIKQENTKYPFQSAPHSI